MFFIDNSSQASSHRAVCKKLVNAEGETYVVRLHRTLTVSTLRIELTAKRKRCTVCGQYDQDEGVPESGL